MGQPEENIDLDALFDMLNIGGGVAQPPAGKAPEAVNVQSNPTLIDLQDYDPFGSNSLSPDTPSDES
jgi:hypothetical protein